jgi:hypothetical protein
MAIVAVFSAVVVVVDVVVYYLVISCFVFVSLKNGVK